MRSRCRWNTESRAISVPNPLPQPSPSGYGTGTVGARARSRQSTPRGTRVCLHRTAPGRLRAMTDAHHWISDPATLHARLASRPTRIGLDTEFIRERTWWPQLALVQIAVDDDILLIDPLAPGIADALREVLVDTSVLKVMHSAGEDLVALKRACGALPQPLFDTQIAAALTGVGAG